MTTSGDEGPALIGYMFLYLPKRPASAEELRSLAKSSAQRLDLALHRRLTKGNMEIVVGWSVSRTTSTFTSNAQFAKAVRLAKDRGAHLVVANLRGLLASTGATRIGDCVSDLDGLDVPFVDASTMRFWADLSAFDKGFLVASAKAASAYKSEAVKAGLGKSTKVRKPVPSRNRRLGTASLRTNAHNRAEALREFVEQEEAALSHGEVLRPSKLRRSLNAAGILSAQGKEWSDQAAKNLLARLRSQTAG